MAAWTTNFDDPDPDQSHPSDQDFSPDYDHDPDLVQPDAVTYTDQHGQTRTLVRVQPHRDPNQKQKGGWRWRGLTWYQIARYGLERERDLCLLDLAGYDAKQIATANQMPVAMVRQIITRARRRALARSEIEAAAQRDLARMDHMISRLWERVEPDPAFWPVGDNGVPYKPLLGKTDMDAVAKILAVMRDKAAILAPVPATTPAGSRVNVQVMAAGMVGHPLHTAVAQTGGRSVADISVTVDSDGQFQSPSLATVNDLFALLGEMREVATVNDDPEVVEE